MEILLLTISLVMVMFISSSPLNTIIHTKASKQGNIKRRGKKEATAELRLWIENRKSTTLLSTFHSFHFTRFSIHEGKMKKIVENERKKERKKERRKEGKNEGKKERIKERMKERKNEGKKERRKERRKERMKERRKE